MHRSSTSPSPSSYLKESFTNMVYLVTLRKTSRRPVIRHGFEGDLNRSTNTRELTFSSWRALLQLPELTMWNLVNISCGFFFHLTLSSFVFWLLMGFLFLFFSNDNSPREFIDLSEALETAGTSAYTGAIQYISNDVGDLCSFFHGVHWDFTYKGYTTAAASILATEARHASWINSAVRKQNPWNTAFEVTCLFPLHLTFDWLLFLDSSYCQPSQHHRLELCSTRLLPGI